MYCTNCGANISDNSKFCTQCGAKIERASVETPVTPELNQRKFGKTGLVIIIAAILIVFSCVVMAKNSIIRAVSPKSYLGIILNNTISKISQELNNSRNELMGFTLTEKDDFTLGLAGEIASMSSEGGFIDYSNIKRLGANFNISVDKGNKQLLWKSQVLYRDNPLLSINFFLNDSEVGVNIPELFDHYWTAGTEKFGRKWNDSYVGWQLINFRISDDLDLSFSKLMDYSSKVITDETRKKIAEITKEFLKHIKIGDMTSSNVTIKGKSVKAREIQVIIEGSELESYLIDIMETYVEDEYFVNQISATGNYDDFMDGFDIFINGFKDNVNIRGDITLYVTEYKGLIVKLELEKEFEVYDQMVELMLEISSNDIDNLINDFKFDFELDAGGETLAIELSSKGNHVPQKGLYTDDTRLVVRIPYEDNLIFESECDVDLKKGTIDGSYKLREGESGIKLDFSGKYINSKGLDISLDDVGITVSSYPGTIKIRGSIDFKLAKGAQKDLIKIGEKQYILDMDEDQIYEYFEEEGIDDRLRELWDSFNTAIGFY
ncbi:MAG TPA: zinc ribbon domain-containing protein [Clostridiaceae bacterium]|nr:zinc ribbon domain-containing protein [Clostridiaceae bacterium]